MIDKNNTDMKSYILNIATKLMTEKGVKETSLSNMAKEANISKGTLYYYYSAKEDIRYDIADRNLTCITNEMLNILNRDKEILKTLIQKVLDAQTRGRLHLYLFK